MEGVEGSEQYTLVLSGGGRAYITAAPSKWDPCVINPVLDVCWRGSMGRGMLRQL